MSWLCCGDRRNQRINMAQIRPGQRINKVSTGPGAAGRHGRPAAAVLSGLRDRDERQPHREQRAAAGPVGGLDVPAVGLHHRL